MASYRDNRGRAVVALVSVAVALSWLSAAPDARAFQSDPPPKGDAASKKAPPKQSGEEKEAAGDEIDTAKKAALESIGKAQKEAIKKKKELIRQKMLEKAQTPPVKPMSASGDDDATAKRLEEKQREEKRKVLEAIRKKGQMNRANGAGDLPGGSRGIRRTGPTVGPRGNRGVRRAGRRGNRLDDSDRGNGRSGRAGSPAAPVGGPTSVSVAAEGEIESPMFAFEATPPDPEAREYRFDWVDTPWPDILKDFARMGGLMLSGDHTSLTDVVTLRSPGALSFDEALHLLNERLLDDPIKKRLAEREGAYLKVWPLPDRIKKIPPEKMYQSFEEFVEADLDEHDMALTFYEPPEGWTPYQIIEEYRTYFDDYYGTQVVGDRIQLTGLVQDHFLFQDVINKLIRGELSRDDGRVFIIRRLEVQKASDMQSWLTRLFSVQMVPAGRGARPGVNAKAVEAKQNTIIANPKNNSLMIKAPPQALRRILEMIDKLDVGTPFTAPRLERIEVQYANAAMLAAALRPIFASQKAAMAKGKMRVYVSPEQERAVDVDILPDPSGGAVVLIGSAEGIASGKAKVASWDVADPRKDHLLVVEHADPNALVGTLTSMFPMSRAGKGGPAMGPSFLATPDGRILARCTDRVLERTQKMLEQLDVPPADPPRERFVQLKSIKPSAIVPVLQNILSGGGRSSAPVIRRTSGKNQRVMITTSRGRRGGQSAKFMPNDAAMMLIVYCTDAEWEKIEPVILRMDKYVEILEPKLVTLALKEANAADVAAMLNQMFPPQRVDPKNPTATPPQQITANPANNTIQVWATQQFIDKISPLVAELDIDSEIPITVIRLEYADVVEVANTLTGMFSSGGRAVRRATAQPARKGRRPSVPVGPVGGGGSVRITAEPLTKSLLVVAGPKDLERIRSMVADMEEAAEAIKPYRVVVDVYNRPADEVASVILSLSGGGRVTAAKPGQRGRPSPRASSSGGSKLKAIASGRRLILEGSPEEVAKAIQLLELIDVVDQEAVFKKYYVSDAEYTEQALRAMLGVAGPTRGGGRSRGRPPGGAKRTAAVSSPSAIQIHASTWDNTILIGAMPEDFPKIDALLKIIEGESTPVNPDTVIDTLPFFTITLVNTKAFDLAWTIEDLLAGPDGKGGPKLDEGPNERTLLVTCKPSQRQRVIDVVKMYDIPPPGTILGPGVRSFAMEGKFPLDMLAKTVRDQFLSQTGIDLEVIDLMESGRVQVVNIHEGEDKDESAAGAARKTGGNGSIDPCVLPASLVGAVGALSIGQTVTANQPRGRVEPRACPVCHQNPCVLPSQLMKSVIAVSTASLDEQDPPDPAGKGEEEEAAPAETHNHAPVTAEPPPASGVPGPGNGAKKKPRLVLDHLTNKLSVVGLDEDMQDILSEIISDITSGKAPIVYRVFPLQYTDVQVAATLLTSVFTETVTVPVQQRQQQNRQQQMAQQIQQMMGGKGDQGGGRGQGGQGGRGNRQRQPRQTTRQVQRSTIKVVPDPRTRTLFVAAEITKIPLIIDLLKQIDKPIGANPLTIRIYRLQNLEASQVVENLREVLGVGAAAQSGRGSRGSRGGRGGRSGGGEPREQIFRFLGGDRGRGNGDGQGGGGNSDRSEGTRVSSDEVKLTADTQTNTIIAQAPIETHALIKDLIDQLEAETNTSAQVMRRVVLEHARATDVASLVQNMLSQSGGRAGNFNRGGRGNRGGGRGGRGNRGGFNRGGGFTGGTGGNVSINADARTNSVILAGQAKDLDRVEKMIKDLDIGSGEGSGIRQFVVQGEPSSIAKALNSVFVTAGGNQSDVVITSDDSTGTVLVKAPGPLMKEIEAQIKEMDSKVAVSQQRRTIKLTLGDAESIAGDLQAIFGESRSRRGARRKITFKGNNSIKTIYVSGADDEAFEEIQRLTVEMDVMPLDIQVKTFPLKYASAIDIDKKLTTMMAKVMASGGMGNFKLDLIGVVPDARTNSLIVTGGPLTFSLIGKVLAEIDVEPMTPVARETRSYPLPNTVNANQVATNIRQLFTGQSAAKTGIEPPSVTANASSNVLMVIANGPQHDQIKTEIIAPITAAVGKPLQDYQIKLEFARADDIKPTLEEFMSKWRQARGNKPQDNFTITADSNSNILLVNCSPETRAIFDKQLKELDTDKASPIGRETRAYAIKFADINSVRAAIDQAFRRSGRVLEKDQVSVSTDAKTNSVIVRAIDDNHEQVKTIVDAMDVEGGTAGRSSRVFVIKYAEPWNLPRVVNEQFRTGSRNVNDQVTASYINGTMSLIVAANAENMEKVATLIEAADVPSGKEKITRYIKLKYARADSLAGMLNQAVRASEPRPRSGVYSVMYGSDMSTNTLVVSAAEDKMAELEAMIAGMDVEDTGGRVTKTFTLTYAEPWNLPNIINQQYRNRLSRNPNDQVTASFINGTMSVVVTANPENMVKITQFIADVDIPSAAQKITRYIKLKFARADSLANMLNQAVRNSEPRPRSGVYSVTYGSEMNTNTLVVSAAEDKLAELEAMIAEMDVEDTGGRVTKIFTLTYAEPWNLPNIINQQYRNRLSRNPNDQVTASYINGTMSVAVTANPENMVKITQFIADVDISGGLQKVTRFIKLKFARADGVANMLNQAVRASEPRPRNGVYSVAYGSEMNSNTLVVSAAEDKMAEIEARVAELDAEDTAGRSTKTFMVRYASARTLANIINTQFRSNSRNPSDQVLASYEDGSMSIIVTANEQKMAEVEALIEQADEENPGLIKETRFIQLEHARADELARSLTSAFQAKTVRDRRGQWPVTITADAASNNLIVTAASDRFEEITEMVAELDVEEQGGRRLVQTFKMTFADPGSVTNAVNTMFRPASRGAAPRDRVECTNDWTTNSVVVRASQENMDEIVKLIEEMDTQGDAERSQHILEVSNSNASDVARSLQLIFDAANRGRRQRSSATIREIVGTTKIAVYANAEELEQIKSLIEKIDVEGGRAVHTVSMPEMVPAESVAQQINDLFGGGRRGRGDGIRASHHEPTNTLLVHATDSEFAKIEKQVIDVIAEAPAHGVLQMYRVQLKYAQADEVAQILQEFFDNKSGRGRNSRRGGFPFFFGGGGGTAAQEIENYVTISAIPSNNMLLVYCTETTKKMIDEIISDIDSDEPLTDKVMHVATLKYMDVQEMIGILQEYLRVSTRTRDDRNDFSFMFGRRGRRGRGGRTGQSEEETVLIGDTRLKAVESMNAIIVVGNQETVNRVLAKIEELDIEDLDRADAPQTIKLVNANANEVADTLNKTFNDPNRRRGGGGRGQTASAVPPTIVAVEATNVLIVRARPAEFNLIKKLAEGLDAEMAGDSGGVRLIQVQSGRNVEDLAFQIESRLNAAEENRGRQSRDYRPSLVSIGADVMSNALLVAGSKAKFEEVERLVAELIAMNPVGTRRRTVIKLDRLSPQQARQLVEQLQEGSTGGSGRTGRSTGRTNRGNRRGNRGRGRRGDAMWRQDRRFDGALENRTPVRRTVVAATLPVFLMNVALGAAVAQTPAKAESQPPASGPKTFTIRKKDAGQDPSKKATETSGGQPARPAGAQRPTTRRSPEELIRAATQPSTLERFTPQAREAFQRRLSNAPITITEAGPDSIIVEANEQDLAILESIIGMLDEAIPPKKIEYRRLKNARATDLAQTLTDVFRTIEQRGERPVQPEDQVEIIADPRTNGIYIAATDAKMAEVLRMVEQNEETKDLGRQLRVFKLENRRVTEAGEVLKRMVSSYLSQRKLPTDAIQVEIDQFTNSVMVTGGQSDLEFVEKIIEGLDEDLPDPADEKARKFTPGTADIMVVPLRIAEADTLGTLLNELLQKAATGDTPMKDFIRRFRLLDENGVPLATVDLNRPIMVFGETGSNSLIIASTLENCLIMKQVALAFDKEPLKSAVEHKIITLVHADATEVATKLEEMLSSSEELTQRPGKSEKGGQPEGTTGTLVYKAVVKADARTNQLIIIGRPEAVTVLTELATSLDIKGLDVMPFEIIPLEYASAVALETALIDLITKRAEALPTGGENSEKAEMVIIKGDPNSNSLIIAARKARMDELKELIAKLDIEATALIEDIRTITLRQGNATEMADKLKALWEERKAQQQGGGEGFQIQTPAIVADPRSNSLIVAASEGEFNVIKAVVEKIEALELNPMSDIYIVALKYNAASQLASAFTALFQKRAEMRTLDGNVRPEDQVEIQVDEVTNSLIVVASRENIEVLRRKVIELDQEMGIAGQIEFFVCNNILAADVKTTVEELFGGDGIYKPGATGEGPLAQRRERVTVTIDDRANMLIVSASPENMSVVREIYTRMNSVVKPWDAAITKLITIRHGDAVRIAAQLQNHFDQLEQVRRGGQGGQAGSATFGITVFADDRSNRLVIGGTRDGIAQALDLVAKLDVPKDDTLRDVVVYGPLSWARVDRIGEMIDRIFEERNQPRGGQGTQVPSIPVTVEADVRSNSLLISASNEDHILIRDMIAKLDTRSALTDMIRLFQLENADPDKIKETLEELFQAAGGQQGAGSTIGVTADKRANAVLVVAPPGELDNLESLIRQLDTSEPIGPAAEIGIFRCDNEDASKMADLLNEILTGAAASGGGAGSQENEEARQLSSRLIKYVSKDAFGEETLIQTMGQNVRIGYNERTNSVLVVAPPSTLKLIESLIRKLDGFEKRSVMVKVFVLQKADATQMVDLLEALFAQDEGSEREREFQRGREFEVEGGLGSSGAVPTGLDGGATGKGTFGRPKTTFVSDDRTNAVIAAGWPEDIDVVATIIEQLDSRAIQEREHMVFTLVNADAQEVEQAVQTYFQAESQRLQSLGDGIPASLRMDQEVSVVSHEQSNQLIVSVSPRYKSRVLDVIEQLDMPPPQVMIQVMIAEVTLDDRFEMGLEFALQQLRFSETAAAGPNGVLQSTHFDVIGGTDLGAAGAGLGGFSFTITGEDFNFLVRALQSDSRLEVISRPQIMCQDNQVANITIGQRVPFVTNTQVSDTGQTSSQVTYEEVGIILDVEPHINPDGWVYMRVAPEISGIADSVIDLGNGVTAPIFTQRSADTFVAVRDGETVVIGGLITTQESEAESKVPFLGDIPGLGVLFRTTTRSKQKTELLIALTPRIIRTVEDGRRLSIQERDASGIITPSMKQSPLFLGLREFPESGDELESVDTPPTVPGVPDDLRGPAPKRPGKKYGPRAPKYGPRIPSKETVARADAATGSFYGTAQR